MSILQGTPISTQGVHPLVAIMAQGGDILSRGYQGAAQQQARNTSLTMSFLQDAARERIEAQRQQLEERKMNLSAQLTREKMDQDRQMHAESLAARERMASMRASASGSGGLSATALKDQRDMAARDQFAKILGGIFEQAGAQPAQAQPQPDAASGIPIIGEMSAGMQELNQLEQARTAVETKAHQATRRDLSVPENFDEVDQAYDMAQKINWAAAAVSTDVSDMARYSGYAASMKLKQALYRQERAKENGDINGLAVIEGVVDDTLNWTDGFTGKKNSTPEDLKIASQRPEVNEALTLLGVPSEKLALDLRSNEVGLDKIASVLDVYNNASSTIQRQQDDAVFLMSQRIGKDGSVVDARAPVRSRFDEDPTVKAIRGHQKVLTDAFNRGVKTADLTQLPKSVLLRMEPTADLNVIKASEAVESAKSWETQAREDAQAVLGADEKGNLPGMWQLQNKLDQLYDPNFSKSEQSAEYLELERLRNSWSSAKKAVRSAEAELSQNQAALSRIRERISGQTPEDDTSEGAKASSIELTLAETKANKVIGSLEGFTPPAGSEYEFIDKIDAAIDWANKNGKKEAVVSLGQARNSYIASLESFNKRSAEASTILPGTTQETVDPVEKAKEDAYKKRFESLRGRVGSR